MRLLFMLGLVLGAALGAPSEVQRIVGGEQTTISVYPQMAALLFSQGTTNFRQACAGVILNDRSIMTVAHCTYRDSAARWRIRAGSNNPNSGGTLFNTARIYEHESFSISTLANDIAILRTATSVNPTANIQYATRAGATYELAENQWVRAVGWGATQHGGAHSTQLRHVALGIINQETCATNYAAVGMTVTDDMVCAAGGFGADQCQGDAGGPLFDANSIVVAISSFGFGCGQSNFPGVNTRLSSYATWLNNNA